MLEAVTPLPCQNDRLCSLFSEDKFMCINKETDLDTKDENVM